MRAVNDFYSYILHAGKVNVCTLVRFNGNAKKGSFFGKKVSEFVRSVIKEEMGTILLRKEDKTKKKWEPWHNLITATSQRQSEELLGRWLTSRTESFFGLENRKQTRGTVRFKS